MRYYQSDGYLDMRGIIEHDKSPVIVVMNGRGTGKTFGALDYVISEELPFILMRRTQTQVELMRTDDLSPFKAVNREKGYNVIVKPINKYVSGAYKTEEDKEKLIGYILALSTFASVRGFDASNVQLLLYDEFIPEPHERPIKQEGQAFLNCYESINRNRELQGEPPLKALLLSNTNTMYSPILEALGVLYTVEKMKKRKQDYSRVNGLVSIYMPNDSPISAAKKSTVLYKIANNKEFVKMSLENEFSTSDTEYIKPRPIKEYIAVVNAGSMTVYKHKSADSYYITENQTGRIDYGQSKVEKQRFCKRYGYLYFKYVNGKVTFQNFAAKLQFEWYFT